MHAKERRVTWDDEINREKFFDHMKDVLNNKEERKALHSSFKKTPHDHNLITGRNCFKNYKFEIKEAPEEEDDNPLRINLTLCPFEPPNEIENNFSTIANFSENLTKEETESYKSNKKSNSSNSFEKKKKKKKFRKVTKRVTHGNLEELAKVYSKSPIEKHNPRKCTVDTPNMILSQDYRQDFSDYLNISRAKSSSLHKSNPSTVKLQKNNSHQSKNESLPHKLDMLNIIDSLKELEETIFAQDESDD